MKIAQCGVATVFGIVMVYALHQLIALMMLAHGWKGLTPSDWAAWVQAVGSVGAIIASGVIANWQYKKNFYDQELRRKEADLVPVLAILTLARELEFQISMCIRNLQNALDLEVINGGFDPKTRFDTLESMLKAIPLHQLPNHHVVRDMATLLNLIPYARTRLTDLTLSFATDQWDNWEVRVATCSIKEFICAEVTKFENHVLALGGTTETGTNFWC